MAPFQDEMTAAPIAPREQLRVFRAKDPYIALGLAVSHLMTKPAFANLRFGDWSRILTGQINRKHYYFAVDSKNQIQGFMGWAVTSKEKAEAWVEGRGAVSFADSRDGDCLIFNAWAANTPEVNRFLVSQAREIMQGKDTVYFKRHYKDGSTRPVRLRAPISPIHIGKLACSPREFSKAKSHRTCRCSSRPNLNSSSICEPRRRSASRCRHRCSHAPTR